MSEYDVIIIGAGSIGVPTAYKIAETGQKVLCLDRYPSPGQGDNKHAIGGIRATHSQKAKIWVSLRSLEILRTWEKKFGDDIEWYEGGYLFVAYSENDAKTFKQTVSNQQKQGLDINWIDAQNVKELVPGISEKGLIGGTYSPKDGNTNSLLTNHAFYAQALHHGAEFKFKEEVIDIHTENDQVTGVRTTKDVYKAPTVINAAGGYATAVAKMVGLDVPVTPDSHEAGITEPVDRFFSPMIVDIRPQKNERYGNSKNYYFYQNKQGQLIFCITPDPPIYGYSTQETSSFLPQVSQRMIDLLPRLQNLKVRRTWRGLYPNTPDGSPIVGNVKYIDGYINAVGMGGQGLMLGPGLSEVIARLVNDKTTEQDDLILKEFSLHRDFRSDEIFK
ncbi:MAG: NAD(P)/FAD-dependent oxidoreductase [Candidatus Heimdallarchaeota archaeon]